MAKVALAITQRLAEDVAATGLLMENLLSKNHAKVQAEWAILASYSGDSAPQAIA